MAQAKVLTEEQITKAVATIKKVCREPLRDTLMMMLSFRAGLCAQEIAYLEVDDVTDVEGRLLSIIKVQKTTRVAKRKPCKTALRARDVPMTKDLRDLLERYMQEYKVKPGPLFTNQYDKPMSRGAVQMQLTRIYRKAGFTGASSHSGRRTWGTRLARTANNHGCSLKDVQALMGHADIRTTELYVELNERHADLVSAVASAGASA